VSSPSPSESLEIELDRRLPATWLAVATIVAVHLASAVVAISRGLASPLGALLLDRPVRMRIAVGGQELSRVADGDVWRLATSVLLHADALHLTLNAMALLVLGRILEPWVGGIRYLSWFVLGGVGGSIVSQLSGVRQSDGASGGAFALLGAAVVLGWRWRDRLGPEDRRLLGPVLGFFLVLNVVLSFVLPFVDAAGHVGGLLVGVAVAWLPRTRALEALDALIVGLFVGVCAFGWSLG
jgi:membrane associated rhomboid family serine protease